MKYRSMLLASAALHAGIANGMGLGNIDVQSYLGSPLEAQIQLLSPGDLGVADIRVNLAQMEVYQRFDARYEDSHGSIQFDVVTTAQGHKAVLVRTSKRIVEPFLDIVVELSWPSGTTYRRYNLLLDPPGYASRWRNPQAQFSPVVAQAVIRPAPVEPKPVVAKPDTSKSVVPDIALDVVMWFRPGIPCGKWQGNSALPPASPFSKQWMCCTNTIRRLLSVATEACSN